MNIRFIPILVIYEAVIDVFNSTMNISELVVRIKKTINLTYIDQIEYKQPTKPLKLISA